MATRASRLTFPPSNLDLDRDAALDEICTEHDHLEDLLERLEEVDAGALLEGEEESLIKAKQAITLALQDLRGYTEA